MLISTLRYPSEGRSTDFTSSTAHASVNRRQLTFRSPDFEISLNSRASCLLLPPTPFLASSHGFRLRGSLLTGAFKGRGARGGVGGG
eukprot:766004-Hanusia_phi.AAC.2